MEAMVEPSGAFRGRDEARNAERHVLGSCFRWNGCVGDVARVLRAEDFSVDAHRRIFAAVVDLFDRGKPVDAVGVADLLNLRGEVEDAGGYAYLAELWDCTPTGALAEHYAAIVRDHALRLRLVGTATGILRESYDRTGPADELVEAAERSIFEVAQSRSGGEVLAAQEACNEACDDLDRRIEAAATGRLLGLPTGLIDVDAKTAGLQPSEFITLGARPSVGKTALATQIALNACAAGHGVFFASLEQSRVELMMRMLCNLGRVNMHRYRKGTVDDGEMERLLAARRRLVKLPLYIDDTSCQTVTRIGANARRLKLRHDIRLVVIDYLQLIEADSRKVSRQEQVSSITRRLKLLARDLKVPVLVLAQLNREVEGRTDHRPRLADLRESGSVEQDSDTVFLLHRPLKDGVPEVGVVEVIIAKQRNGPTGDVPLTFQAEFTRFENYAAMPDFAPRRQSEIDTVYG